MQLFTIRSETVITFISGNIIFCHLRFIHTTLETIDSFTEDVLMLRAIKYLDSFKNKMHVKNCYHGNSWWEVLKAYEDAVIFCLLFFLCQQKKSCIWDETLRNSRLVFFSCIKYVYRIEMFVYVVFNVGCLCVIQCWTFVFNLICALVFYHKSIHISKTKVWMQLFSINFSLMINFEMPEISHSHFMLCFLIILFMHTDMRYIVWSY